MIFHIVSILNRSNFKNALKFKDLPLEKYVTKHYFEINPPIDFLKYTYFYKSLPKIVLIKMGNSLEINQMK